MKKILKNIFGSHHGLDQKSVDFLINALEKNNLPGFDYIEFKQALSALSEQTSLDEANSYKSAFATATVLGLTKEALLKTAEHYRQVLNGEKTQFDAALQKQVEQRLVNKQKEIADLHQQIALYRKTIQELEGKIQQAESTILKANEDISAEKGKIESTRDAFELTHNSILNQIQQDIDCINKHI